MDATTAPPVGALYTDRLRPGFPHVLLVLLTAVVLAVGCALALGGEWFGGFLVVAGLILASQCWLLFRANLEVSPGRIWVRGTRLWSLEAAFSPADVRSIREEGWGDAWLYAINQSCVDARVRASQIIVVRGHRRLAVATPTDVGAFLRACEEAGFAVERSAGQRASGEPRNRGW